MSMPGADLDRLREKIQFIRDSVRQLETIVEDGEEAQNDGAIDRTVR